MSFQKDGEVKVYKHEEKIGTKKAGDGETGRYTVDDLVKDSEKEQEEDSDKEEE